VFNNDYSLIFVINLDGVNLELMEGYTYKIT